MSVAIEENLPSESKDTCNILVLYDGDVTRARALEACDCLVSQFWQDVEIAFHWWRTDFLRDSNLATVASANAVAADFFIVCLDPHQEVGPALESWFESWLPNRRDHEGALVDLTNTRKLNKDITANEIFLRQVSRRGNFEYVPVIPDDANASYVSKNSAREKNQDRDNTFNARPPSHFGLNE